MQAGSKYLTQEIECAPDDDPQDSYGMCATCGRMAFVWVLKYPEHKGHEGALVHELNHAVDGLLRYLNIKDDEARSYFFQHYYRQAKLKLSRK
jgi:hypothetical protein